MLVLGTMTHYAAVDGSEVGHSVIGNHRLTFRVSGRVRRVDKNGCGLPRLVASGVGVRKVIRRLNLILLLLGPQVVSLKGQLPRTVLQAPASESQACPSDWHDAKFPSVEPALAGWSG